LDLWEAARARARPEIELTWTGNSLSLPMVRWSDGVYRHRRSPTWGAGTFRVRRHRLSERTPLAPRRSPCPLAPPAPGPGTVEDSSAMARTEAFVGLLARCLRGSGGSAMRDPIVVADVDASTWALLARCLPGTSVAEAERRSPCRSRRTVRSLRADPSLPAMGRIGHAGPLGCRPAVRT